MAFHPPVVIAVALLAGFPAASGAQFPDHLKCYKIKDPLKLKGVVDLDSPQFGLDPGCRISRAKFFCVPTAKAVVEASDGSGPIDLLTVAGPNPGDRLCYRIKCQQAAPAPLELSDQFGTRVVESVKAYSVCVPAVKGPPPQEPEPPSGCYDPAASNYFIRDCNFGGGSEVTSRIGPPAGSGWPALRIIGIYETPAGVASVSVNRAERTVLVLAAYGQTHWTVTVSPEATLERVILVGWEPQTATVPPGVPLENRSPDTDWDCGYAWPPSGDCDTRVLIAGAEEATGLCLTSFHGCYDASEFAIPNSPSGAFLD